MKNEVLSVCDQLVAAAANGVYQGIIIALLVALCLRWLVRTNAATRHAIWFCTLLLLVALVVAHGLVDCLSLRRATTDSTAPASVAEVATPSVDPTALSETATKTEDNSGNSVTVRDDRSNTKPHPLLTALIKAQREHLAEVAEQEQPNGIEPDNAQGDDAGLTSHLTSGTTDLRGLRERLLNPVSMELAVGSRFARMASMLILLWLILAGLRVAALIVQLARIRKLKHQSLLPGTELNELFQRLATRLVTNRQVELRLSAQHRSSFLLGFRHPVVLLPAEERMELAETELVLRHELAHLERRDDWANLIQHSVLAVFFFHPAFWWISRQLSLEREIACDDHVLQQSKRPQAYALVLANLAARMQKRLPLLAPGSSNHKTQLKERIDMILNTHRNASPRLAKTWLALITSTAAIVAVAVIGLAPRIVLAQIETTPADAAVTPSADALPVVPATDVAPVAAVAGLPYPGPADDVPPTPPVPAVVGAGPKFKPGGPVVITTSPVVVATPDIALAPVKTRLSVIAATPGHPGPILAAIESPAEPNPLRAPRPAKAPRSEDRDSSLEERLDRLEHMLNSLMNQQNPRGRSDFQLKLEKDGMIDRKEMAKLEALAKQQAELAQKINPEAIEKMKKQAERDAQRAVEQMKRATAEVEKARKADQKEAVQKLKADSKRQAEDLQKKIEDLERQREKLDREIERLEQDQEKLNEQDEASADNETELSESKEVCATQSNEVLVTQSHSTR